MKRPEYECEIDGISYNLKHVLELIKANKEWDAKAELVKIRGGTYSEATTIIENIKANHYNIPWTISTSKKIIPERFTPKKENKIPTCPRCGSTYISTGARGVDGFWGFFGASRTVNRCANCGYSWEPRG